MAKNNSIDDRWMSYLKPTNDSTPGKMCVLIKMHEVGNTARVVTIRCSITTEKLYIFVKTVLFDLANYLPPRMRDTGHMLSTVDELNRSNLPPGSIIFRFDIVNMFPSI